MNTQQRIFKAFNPVDREVKENIYKPRIQSTVKPEKVASFNEVFEHIHEQLKTK